MIEELFRIRSVIIYSLKAIYSYIFHQVGAEIFKHALSYPSKLIAKNAGANGSIVVQKVNSPRSFLLKAEVV